MKLLAIVGSPRLKGNTNYLVDCALEEAAGLGVDTRKVVLSQLEIAPCLGHDDCESFSACQQQDDAGWLLEELCAADGVILATPVYYYDVSAQMKAFIDRNYFLYTHSVPARAASIGLIVVGESVGLEDALHTLRLYVGSTFGVGDDRILTACGYAARAGEVKDNLYLVEETRKLGQSMAEQLLG